MLANNRALFRPAALAHYQNPNDGNAVALTPKGFWALARLVLTLIGSVLLAPFARWQRRLVPVVLQMTTTQCGAACLTMVLNYYGRAVSLSEIAEQMDVGRDGTTALAIAQSALPVAG